MTTLLSKRLKEMKRNKDQRPCSNLWFHSFRSCLSRRGKAGKWSDTCCSSECFLQYQSSNEKKSLKLARNLWLHPLKPCSVCFRRAKCLQLSPSRSLLHRKGRCLAILNHSPSAFFKLMEKRLSFAKHLPFDLSKSRHSKFSRLEYPTDIVVCRGFANN